MLSSVLDEIPGIGPAKRNALLEQFGSIDAIKETDVGGLVKVTGITKDLAEKILKHLR
jgi:excinuclease ABC subunit C